MKILYFDCFSGISGDMCVGALIDAGADFETIQAGLATLGVEGYSLAVEKVQKKGIMATQFHVHVDPDVKQPHRHLRHVIEIIEAGDLPEVVKAASIDTFRRLAEAEATVHGSTPEKVHFHEVGAVDSIVDTVGAQYALHLLGVDQVAASVLHVGGGTVECAHGTMPVPAPATALLLRGKPTCGGDAAAGELVTPTGAALLDQCAAAFGPVPAMTVSAIGYGAGTKDLPDRANVLRVCLGDAVADTEAPETEEIAVIEAHVDDMSGELMAPALAAVLDAGARDAFITPALGKKGRPVQLFTVLCAPGDLSAMVGLLFAHTTTLGVRTRMERRFVLARDWTTAVTPWGTVRVKRGRLGHRVSTAAPEFEDCRECAAQAGVPVREVYAAACAAAWKEMEPHG
ncbi:MAG: nickel pincer cofactor biosynthesis protein LarC [Candidatus Hydrogenedentota bacterium]